MIFPDFPLELTGFFSGKHLIHFLVLKMKDFRNFVHGLAAPHQGSSAGMSTTSMFSAQNQVKLIRNLESLSLIAFKTNVSNLHFQVFFFFLQNMKSFSACMETD